MGEEKRGLPGRVLLAFALSLCAALIFCWNNTPLGPGVGSDNAMYLTMGTALARGYAPYTQIFDHKGPLLFALQTVPQLFFGGYQTATVFVMEWLFLAAQLLVVGAICRRIRARGAWAAQLIYLAAMMPCMEGGNLSEEYANLFTLLGLCLIVAAFGEEEKERVFLPAAGVGALATLSFLTRANNALPLLGATFALALYLCVCRRWKRLMACAGGFIVGCGAALAPVVLWLAGRGALSEAVYGAIIHNLMYAQTEGASRIAMLLTPGYGGWAMLMAGLTALGALACALRTRRAAVPLAMLFCALGAGVAGFISHKFYLHYLMLGAPGAALGAGQCLSLLGERKPRAVRAAAGVSALVCCAALAIAGAQANGKRLVWREGCEQFADDAIALYAQVPEEDRGSFMAYRVEPKWYVATRALPCMRFYFLQEILGQADPRVMDEIARDFETNPPRWLVIYYNRAFSPPYDERVREIFETRYAFVDARGEYQLLKRKETD